jgi:hypothetical protein
MAVGTSNLLLRLQKWAARQEENFTTEAFAHLLEHLLTCEPRAGVHVLKCLTGDVIDLAPDEAAKVEVNLQATTAEGRPDICIRSPGRLVYVEVKVDLGPGDLQIDRYLSLLRGRDPDKSGVILLTRHLVVFGPGEARPRKAFRWHHVAEWLEDGLGQGMVAGEVSAYLTEQFLGYLRGKNMTVEQVT